MKKLTDTYIGCFQPESKRSDEWTFKKDEFGYKILKKKNKNNNGVFDGNMLVSSETTHLPARVSKKPYDYKRLHPHHVDVDELYDDIYD